MKLLASLDPKDRRMLYIVLGLVAVLFVLLAVFTPAQDPNRNQVPSSYLTGRHGAKAAFTLLQQSGYTVERWEQPLGDLAAQAGPTTVLILAEPFFTGKEDRKAIATILAEGGRVLATGYVGGLLLPQNAVTMGKEVTFAACEAKPEGLQPLAGGGPIWIVPRFSWRAKSGMASKVRTAYTCAGEPVVVEYSAGKGHVVWWASSTPLENGSITRGGNLELLLNSIAPAGAGASAQGLHVYWDESLHGQVHTQWEYAKGPIWPLLWLGAMALALLVILSYSRRSGPVRALPQAPRTTPIEFLHALGALYRSTGAASTALQVAWERFRAQIALLTGQRTFNLHAVELAVVIERRFGFAAKGMEADLIAAEEACSDDALKPRRALALVKALRRHEETLSSVSAHGLNRTSATSGVTLGT